MNITLDALLAARDTRRDTQQQLLQRHSGCVPVVLTVNIPGPEKRTQRSVAIGHEGMRTLLRQLEGSVTESFVRDLPTGFEGYAVVSGMTPRQIKEITTGIESSHPLGRVMDIDVIGPDGSPVSRTDAGESPRRCLICDEDARVCMRLRTHSVEELLEVINRLHDEYFHSL